MENRRTTKVLAALVTMSVIIGVTFAPTGAAAASSAAVSAGYAVVKSKALNMRTGPSTDDQVIEVLSPGTDLVVLAQPDRFSWTKVSHSGKVGYVSDLYIKRGAAAAQDPTPAAPAVPAWETKADQVIAFGRGFMGVPYVWGGDYDKDGSMGFDCSGFTSYIFAKYGVSLHRTSRDMVNDGVAVSKAQLRKGDLILTDTNHDGVINHVSVYIGNDQVIHTYKVGVGVTISKFSGSSWDRAFVSARRVIK